MIRILLVDDQKSIRERLKSLLETEPDFDIVGMVDNGYDAIEQVKLLLPDVVLMDMEMPDIDGVLATKIISHSSRKTKVLVLSSHDSDEYVADSIYAGANGYILKGAPAQEICDAVRFVNRGYMQIAPGLFEKFIPNKIEAGLLEWKPRPSNERMPVSRIEYPGSLELTGINKRTAAKNTAIVPGTEFEQPSELILDITALSRSRKSSIGWYQATALVVAGLGLTCSLYLIRQSLNKPAQTPERQDRAQQLQNLPFVGKIEPLHITKIDATIPGIVTVMPIVVGQTVKAGDRLLSIRNVDAERANRTKQLSAQQLMAQQQQIAIQQASQQQQQALQQQQLAIGERQAAAGRISNIQLAIANYQRNLAPLRQQVADANVKVNLVATQTERLPLSQKREAITRTQAIYERTLATYERLAQYQSEGAISQERVEQAEKEMTVAKSDLNIARSDYDSLVDSAKVTTEKQAAQTRSTQLQQQLALIEQAGQLQQLQAQLQIARADFQQIETKLQQIQKTMPNGKPSAIASSQMPILEPTQSDVTAPISGMAIEIPISLGDRVFAGSKLMSITNPRKLKIGVDVEAQQAALLKTGQKALVKVGTAIESQELVALVTNIAPPVDRSTQRIEVEFTNPKPTVLIGQNGTVYFPK
ncbi:response regulator [Chamaesiphon sp. GL140_3_metabinner_50]|uniref:response regulator n=1 Tax=Chamaesiphon sp. GL140_3_metabinner_50 TaxID=2970812 RepID=UPI0025DC8F9C|nr:response regulator [Chamaesiphon sp. GL140_3_metabinner_50]